MQKKPKACSLNGAIGVMPFSDMIRSIRPSVFRRYLVLSFFILKQDGWAALIHRLNSKLKALENLPSPPALREYQIASTFGPLLFKVHEHPLVSIIIPFHNQPLFTFSCLNSILEHASGIPFEVVLVDDQSDRPETIEMLKGLSNVTIVRNPRNLGFLKSCNHGAEKANGRFLLFLNNDTLVTRGWLNALINTFKAFPDAGIVGCKLIYPNGSLQEAGGIVWRDGSAWNYGRFDDPGRPEYNYLRQVDYCSGACIMVPTALFLKVGGFDDHFSPAYYEDTDLAFRIKRAGKRILYQPQATIVHFEGISSGTDTSKGIKRFQEINREKFFTRWKDTLKGHRNNGIDPELEKDRFGVKRILVVDARMVTPDRDSGSLRMFNILSILLDMGWKVTFAAANLMAPEPYAGDLQARGIELLYGPYVKSFDTYLAQTGKSFDAVLLSRVDLADKLRDTVKKRCPQAFLIFDTVDVHFIREERMAEVNNSVALRWVARERKRQELALVSATDATLVVSPVEKEALSKELPDSRIEIVSNIHDIHETTCGFGERKDLFFIGGFEHPPNVDAVDYYATAIWPRVRQRLRGVKTYIIGSHPPPAIKRLNTDDFIIKGHVKDLSPFLDGCKLSIAPLRFGAGVKGKINLSMSHGVPVVATPIGVEGMHLINRENVMIADEPNVFANVVAEVYENRNLWEHLSKMGKRNVEDHFSVRAAEEALNRVLSLASVRI